LLREVVRQALALHASLEDVSHSPPGYRQKSKHLED
jgi:hypothetical protein